MIRLPSPNSSLPDTFAAAGGTYTAEIARKDLLTCDAVTAECTVTVRVGRGVLVTAS